MSSVVEGCDELKLLHVNGVHSFTSKSQVSLPFFAAKKVLNNLLCQFDFINYLTMQKLKFMFMAFKIFIEVLST